MTALGTTRTAGGGLTMSALEGRNGHLMSRAAGLPPIADIRFGAYNVSTVTHMGRELVEWLTSCLTMERPMNG
jgi:hypothetical protein